jgi:polyhydroxyalkanoate synthesis regulator protein
LLQIIAEEENEGNPLFTTDVLMRFIRMYGDSVQDAFSSYMEQSLGFFDQQTKQFFDQFGTKVDTTPMNVFAEMTRKNLDMWQEAQKNFYKAASGSGEKGK